MYTRQFEEEDDLLDENNEGAIEAGNSSMRATGVNLLTIMVGAGVLGYPALFAKVGIMYGSILLCFAASISTYLCICLGQAIGRTQARLGKRVNKMDELGYECFGTLGQGLACFFVYGTFFAKICIYLVLIGKNLAFIAPMLPYRGWVLVVSAVALPIAFLRDVSVVERFASLGVVASGMYFLCILSSSVRSSYKEWPHRAFMSGGLLGGPYEELKDLDEYPSMGNSSIVAALSSAMSVMIFGFGPVDVLPSARREMKDPEELPRAIVGSHAITWFIYFVCGCVGFWGFGLDVRGNVTLSMCGTPGCIGEIDWFQKPRQVITPEAEGEKWIDGYLMASAVIMNLLVTIPIIFYCFFTGVESCYSPEKPMGTLPNTLMRVVTPLICSIVGLCCPFFLQVVQIVSTLLSVPLVFVLPIVFSYKVSRDCGTPHSLLRLIFDGFNFILGIMVCIIGLMDAIGELTDKMKAEPEEVDILGNFWK